MKKKNTEIVIVWWEGETPSHVLLQNGHTAFYRLKKLTKDEVSNLLDVDVPEGKPHEKD